MHRTSICLRLKSGIVVKGLFILYFFLSACSRNPPIPAPQDIETAKIEAFLTKLLFEEAGIYTLFGDKPITDICFFIGDETDIWLDGLSQEAMKQIVYIDNDALLENWNAWKKYAQSIPFKEFCFVEVPCPTDPLHVLYCLVNVNRVREVIQENELDFKVRGGIDFGNIKREIRNPKSAFWNSMLHDHYLMGLLHGYGKENSSYFTKLLEGKESPHPFETVEGPFSIENFPLPIYAHTPNDSISRKYQQQREEIKKIYENKNFLDVTLNRLRE